MIMPQPRTRIPDHLVPATFTVGEARSAGVSRAVLRHDRFRTNFRGLRSTLEKPNGPGSLIESTLYQSKVFLPALRPGEVFSHTTALLLMRCPIRCDETLHVTTPGKDLRHRRPGLRGHRSSRPFEPMVDAEGIPLMPPARALEQAAAILPLREIVVAIDHLLNQTQATSEANGVFPVDFGTVLDKQTGSIRKRIRVACHFARLGSESRMETLTRLELARWGLDSTFELQVDVRDDAGEWIGRFDLVDRRRKIIIEYDGEQHRTNRAQYLKDLKRLERARAAGYRVIRVHKEDLFDRTHTWVRDVAELLGSTMCPVRPALMRLFEEN